MGHAANVLAFAGIFAVNSVLMYVINQVQQSPYMDEIFHIRQAKHYCHGNFSVVIDSLSRTCTPGCLKIEESWGFIDLILHR